MTGAELGRGSLVYSACQREIGNEPHGLEPFCRVVGELLAGKDQGVNPVERRNADKDTKAGAAVCTFDAIATELVAKKIREGKTERTAKKLRWLFELASHLSVTAR